MTEQELFDTSENPPGEADAVDIPEVEEPAAEDTEPAGEDEPDEPELDPAG
jgi:hypothetical protein